VSRVGKRMVCSACGSRKIDAQPKLYPGGIVAMRERWGSPQDRSDEVGWLVAVEPPSAERSLEVACGNNTKMSKAAATTKATAVPIVIQSHAPF
jgi:hypothetical protein